MAAAARKGQPDVSSQQVNVQVILRCRCASGASPTNVLLPGLRRVREYCEQAVQQG